MALGVLYAAPGGPGARGILAHRADAADEPRPARVAAFGASRIDSRRLVAGSLARVFSLAYGQTMIPPRGTRPFEQISLP